MKISFIYLNNDPMVSRGAGYIVMALRSAGHEVLFFDTLYTTDMQAAKDTYRSRCDLVMISATSMYYNRAKAVARKIKRGIDCPIVLGGAHSTVLGAQLLEDCNALDYLCIGEGEEFAVELAERISLGLPVNDIANLAYRTATGVRANPVRPPTNLNTLGPFDHSIFNPNSVVTPQACLPGFSYVFATRGCPYRCSYCCNSTFLRLYNKSFLRTQNIDTVIEELLDLKHRYPVKLLYFGDEMILFDRHYVSELFNRVQSEVRLPYGCMFRPEHLTDGIADLLKKTGCIYAAMGIECGDERFRREYLNRLGTNQQIINTFRILRKKIPKIFLVSFNMKGYPVSYDDKLTQATKKLNRIVRPNHSQTTWYYPIPGTDLHDYCEERSLINMDLVSASQDYFRGSVLNYPVDPAHDSPIYPRRLSP